MLSHRIHRLFDRIQSRFIRSRAGSVLILVIVLLVLMALLGTAFLVTARNDRVASKLFEQNRQIDLLVDGVKNMALAAMTNTSQRYDDWLSLANLGANGISPTVDHTWLSSRYPTQLKYAMGSLNGAPIYPVPEGTMVISGGKAFLAITDQTMDAPSASSPNWLQVVLARGPWNAATPIWPAVTAPLAANAYFEDPRYPNANPTPAPTPAGARTMVSPTFVAINGTNYPALRYWSIADNQMETALAASASGNGIADSFLWRLPMNTIDGITYYAAVRIIDNNSAIDANTALSSSFDYDYQGNPVSPAGNPYMPGLFQSGIGLTELLYSYQIGGAGTDTASNEMAALNLWRFHGVQRPQGIMIPGNPTAPGPVDDQPVARKDFFYGTLGDSLTMILGRRSFNPGFAWNNSLSGQAQSLTWGDSAALAYKFDLANASGPGTLESCLINSTYNTTGTPMPGGGTGFPSFNFRSTPWDPSQITGTPANPGWSDFYPDETIWTAPTQPPTQFPIRRPYITAHSNLNNLMPALALTPLVGNYNNTKNTTYLPSNTSSFMQQWTCGTAPNLLPYWSSTVAPRCSVNTAYVTALDIPADSSQIVRGPTLWYSFYRAMLGALKPVVFYTTTTSATPSPSSPALSPVLQQPWGGQQFRSPIRDIYGAPDAAAPTAERNPKIYLSGPETVAFRALLAAVNAKDLRDGDDVPTQVIINNFPLSDVNLAANNLVSIRAYGIEKQPFIVEVYANNDTSKQPDKTGADQHVNPNHGKMNPNGYVAIEIYNPNDTPMDISQWRLGILNRTPAMYPPSGMSTMMMQQINSTFFSGFPGGMVIPAKGYLILENTQATPTGTDAIYRPFAAYQGSGAAGMPPPAATPFVTSATPPIVSAFYVQGLDQVLAGGELYLLRPPAPGATNTPLSFWIPIDSFDFTGMAVAPPTGPQFTAIHYLRPNPGPLTGVTTPNPAAWKFVYPGRWDGSGVTTGTYRYQVTNAQTVTPFKACQEGIAVSTWDISKKPPGYDWWVDAGVQPGATNTMGPAYLAPISFGQAAPVGSYPNKFAPIQLANREMPGPYKFTLPNGNPPPANTNTFPFGGFARAGDVMSVPFIGSYAIYAMTPNRSNPNLPTISGIIEMNPVTRDAAMADDDDGGQDDALEQIGRFCPILAAQQPTENVLPVYPTSTSNYDRYGFASHVLEYFSTINNPNDDYLPNMDPNAYAFALNTSKPGVPFTTPWPVANTLNSGAGANKGAEDTVPIEGLINVNTANWRALAAVPFVPTNMPQAVQDNQMIAQSIVSYRNTYGPFKTLFDLNKVPLLSTPLMSFTPPPTTFTFQSYYGDPSKTTYDFGQLRILPTPPPNGSATDGVTNDFETRFGMINRVSNLLTTRSDTFTVYVLVQGWSGVGTSTPQVVLQRRAAFIADRSQLSGVNSSMSITPIQSN